MNFLQAILIVVAPFVPLLLPGIFFVRIHTWNNILLSGSRIILWSMGSLTLLLTLGLYAGVSVQMTALFLAVIGFAYALLYRKYFFTRHTLWHLLAITIPLLLVTLLYSIPFLRVHDGLPTGDVQKTIIWANDILRTNQLPDYKQSISLLNRDPVDFYTPGLHAVSALVLSLSPFPLASIGIFSIVIAVCVGFLAAAITKEMFDTHFHIVPAFLAALFTLTQYRFLRYLREPGYHFQNVVGELFLFGMVLLFIRFIRRREKQDAFLFILCGLALFFSHQFSAFIAVFLCAAMGLACLILFRNKILRVVQEHVQLSLVLAGVALGALGILFSLGLASKVPSIFTSTPHLLSLVPPLTNYPITMGEVWFFAGLTGIVLMVTEAKRKDIHHRQVISFAAATVALVVLSQGPVVGIDIPPVRALFYLALPLSVGAAYLFGKLFFVIGHTYHGRTRTVAYTAVVLAILCTVSTTTYRAYASLSHTVRTNSTLTAGELYLIDYLTGEKKGVLIDDYDRRSASWLTLSGAPMFTRIAADLSQQMEESSQSKLRNELYLKQLDYEKIFELGSLPHISSLFSKNNIGHVTGIEHSSNGAFAHNPLLKPVASADDITLYKVDTTPRACTSIECIFLLRPTTLANDIGDTMDTFEHLQASIRTPLLSEPISQGATTYRTTTSPLIPLSFNIGDYVRVLWDPNRINHPESSLTFMLWLVRPQEGLSLRTPSGAEIALPYASHITIELAPNVVPINEKGFISLSIVNPRGVEVPIDLVALGSSLVP